MEIRYLKAVRIRRSVLVAGWPGIANVAAQAVKYLTEFLEAERIGEADHRGWFSPQGVVVRNSLVELAPLPEGHLFLARRRPDHLVIFLGEAQPARGYEMAWELLGELRRFGLRRVYTCAAAVAPIHHRDHPRVWGAATSGSLLEEARAQGVVPMGEVLGGEGTISGLNGLLVGVARELGLEGICLLGEVPFYLPPQVEFPRATLSVLEVLDGMLRLRLDLGPVVKRVRLWEQEAGPFLDRLFEAAQRVSGRALRRESPQAPRSPGEVLEFTRVRIEHLFEEARRDPSKVEVLRAELERLGLFEEYRERFQDLLRS